MTDTSRFGLPLLAAAQAQKHVTVNEALARLDAFAELAVLSRSLATPPVSPVDGATYAVPAGAGGDWTGQDGRIALFLNGGWIFQSPARGWRAWIVDEGSAAVFDGAAWSAGFLAGSAHGAMLLGRVVEFDHAVTAGTSNTTLAAIPANAVVVGVTARVVTAIPGTLASWQLGNSGAVNRFGSGLGTAAGSTAHGVLGAPMAFYAATPLVVTATGGSFAAGGVVRIAVHCLEIAPPGI